MEKTKSFQVFFDTAFNQLDLTNKTLTTPPEPVAPVIVQEIP